MRSLNVRNIVYRGFCLFLILAYAESFLPITHDHEEGKHVHEHQKIYGHDEDACFEFIYHGIKSDECIGHDHLVADEDDCIYCHFLSNPSKTVAYKSQFKVTIVSSSTQIVVQSVPVLRNSFTNYLLRGPPSTV